MKFIVRDKVGVIDILTEDTFHDIHIGIISLGGGGVYVFNCVHPRISITGRHLSQIVDKLADLNRTWMDADSSAIRAAYL